MLSFEWLLLVQDLRLRIVNALEVRNAVNNKAISCYLAVIVSSGLQLVCYRKLSSGSWGSSKPTNCNLNLRRKDTIVVMSACQAAWLNTTGTGMSFSFVVRGSEE